MYEGKHIGAPSIGSYSTMASSQPANFDGSLDYSFLSVQELITSPMISVPEHFLAPNLETPTSFECTSFAEIPTIDMNLLFSVETTGLELEKLHAACKDWGFFQVKNHGVSSLLLDKLRYEITEFYKLPLDQKMKYKVRQGEVEGYGPLARPGAKGDWGDRFYMITNPIHRRKSHLFPELHSSLRNDLECYILELQNLGKKLLGFMAKGLNIEPMEMEKMFDNGMQAIRTTYYPPCPQPELVLGIPPHSDASGITILNQLNGIDGLQIKKDGLWLPVHFLPDALVVNLGDILEILSNGIYKSVEHRTTINAERERISIAFFVNPKIGAEIGPANVLVNPENPPMFRNIGMEQYIKGHFSRMLNGKSYLDQIRIKLPGGTTDHGDSQ